MLRWAYHRSFFIEEELTLMDYFEMAQGIEQELFELRRSIHSEPELGNHEFKTAEKAESYLRSLGLEVRRVCGTGIVATLYGGKPGKTAALRADIDALPITEATGCSFESKTPGVMHACGHDFHLTAALGAAKLLSMQRESLRGNVRFLLQPDEEGSGGAQRMIAEGVLDDPFVDAVFGMHVNPELPAGTVGVRYGKFYAASNVFTVRLTGRSSHGAEPEKGINALAAAAEMLIEVENLRKKLAEKHGRLIITVGKLNAGTADNIVPGEAVFSGIIRTLGPDARSETLIELRALLESIAQRHGVLADINIRGSYPGVVNHDVDTALVERTAIAALGSKAVINISQPTMTTEDFGYFVMERGGCFWHLGTGGEYPIHNPRFLPDEKLLPTAAALHATIITSYLEENR